MAQQPKVTAIFDPNAGETSKPNGLKITGGTVFNTDVGLSADGAIIVAGTTQTQAGATPLLAQLSQVNAANVNDGVRTVFAALPGMSFDVCTINSTATVKIYPNGTDKIDSGSASAAVTLTSGHRGATFRCFIAGNWVSSLYGAISS